MMETLSLVRFFRSWLDQGDGLDRPSGRLSSHIGRHRNGRVDLVGAGPGDPELLTRKAWRLLNSCDVIVYDALVSRELIASLPRTIELHYVGKRQGQHSATQQEICTLMVRLAQQGKHVVRLKGGDPLVFGRLGEELDALRTAAIPYTIVPGITAASGCAASLGFPLTERGISTRLRLITAQFSEPREIDWPNLARTDETLVFYMGLSKAAVISAELINAGLPADYPVLLVENGTQAQQRAIETTLAEMNRAIAVNQVAAPALIYVGRVFSRPVGVAQTRQHLAGAEL